MEAKLIVVGGQATKSEVPLTKFPVLIGRNRTADLPIAHPLVSRNHCEIYQLRGALVVRDLESANGTRINDEVISEDVLRPGSRLTVGPLTFVAIYKYAGDVPDLESLRASEEEDGPFFEDASNSGDPVSLSAEDIVEADLIEADEADDIVQPVEKPKPSSKLGLVKPSTKVSDKEATLEFNNRKDKPGPGKKEDEDSLQDLRLEDLLLDSVIDPGKPPAKPSTAGESGVVSPYSNSGVQIRPEEGVVTRNEVKLGGLPSPKPASKTPVEKPSPKPAKKEPAKKPAHVEPASSIDATVEEALSIEDSEDFLLEEPQRAKLTNRTIDESLDQAIVDASSDSFDAVKLLSGTPRPPDKNPRGGAREDDKQVISFVLTGKDWENSGVRADQLREARQPTDFLLRLQLPDAGRIKVGTPVRVAGIDVGMVTDLNWVATGGQLRAEALLNIQKRLGEVLRDDCRVNVNVQEGPESVVIVIESPGSSDKRLENGQVLLPK